MQKKEARILRKIGKILKTVRQLKGLSVKDVAEKCGLTIARLEKIESGEKDYPLINLLSLCDALELDAAEILKQAGL